jgi:hypothetical protein
MFKNDDELVNAIITLVQWLAYGLLAAISAAWFMRYVNEEETEEKSK